MPSFLNMRNRLRFISVFFLLGSIAIVARLFYWQIIKTGELTQQARAQQITNQKLDAQRGSILAKDGTWMVSSVDAWRVYASLPELTKDPKTLANILAPILVDSPKEGEDPEQLLRNETVRLENLLNREGVWVALKNQISQEKKEKIEKLDIPGIGLELQESRIYPEGSSSAHLLGFVGQDEEGMSKGYFGLEGFYDLTLAGEPGFWQREANALGVPLIGGLSRQKEATRGVDLVTHIDKTIQIIAEQKLKEGMEVYGAIQGTVIVLRPKDGAVLAMAALPAFDPAKFVDYGNDLFKNPAISDSFEPGSVFKPIIMAAALDAGVVKPDTKCDICGGPLTIGKYQIRTWDNNYFENSTMAEVIMHSDNVGMSFVGQKLGKERVIDYLKKFGLGETTGIDLQGEARPPLRDEDDWGDIDVATSTFGQGIAVTPIQMVSMINTIARGGVKVTPQVVDKLKIDGWEEDILPKEGERVISEKAAREMTEMMVLAASQGEAKWAIPKGFKIAGKTGTAQIPVSGHYDTDKTIASFVGFAPPVNPKFVMLVTLREPQSSPWASETAAPLWFSIARELFTHMGIQPMY